MFQLQDFQPSPYIHSVFEMIGIFLASFIIRRQSLRKQGLGERTTQYVYIGGIVGGILGAKLLVLFETWQPELFYERLLVGKTIVGGLLGGWLGVEVAKKIANVKTSTGDQLIYPLFIGLCIGRIGCFLLGLADDTYGTPTTLPWSVVYEDRIPRHPTPLYEIVYLVIVMGVLRYFTRMNVLIRGEVFLLGMMSYFTFRFGIEFIKPFARPYFGLSYLQVASSIGVLWALQLMYLRRRERRIDG